MKKKILFILLVGVMLLGVTGCGTEETTETTTQKTTVEKENGKETTTVIDNDGTKTITVVEEDGTKTITVIKPDGTEKTTIINADGTIRENNPDDNRYEVTDYIYVTVEKKYLQGTPVDVSKVQNNQRIYQSELESTYPNLYNVAKEVVYDWTADAISGNYRVNLSTYLYPTSFHYQSTGKIEYFFTVGEIYYDSDGDGYTDSKGTGYFIAPIKQLNEKYPNLVDYIKSNSIYN